MTAPSTSSGRRSTNPAGVPPRATGGNGRALPAMAPPGGRRRRWSLALVAILVTVGSALAFAVLWSSAGDRRPVLAAARTVPAGQVIAADDLVVVRVSGDPSLDPLASERRDEVVGQTASFDLVAGSLLTEASVGEQTALAPGTAIVSVALTAGELPTSSLRQGDQVQIVFTQADAAGAGGSDAGASDAGSALGRLIGPGEVAAVEPLPDLGATRVSLVVAEADVADVAGGEASDQISLALVPNR